MQKEKSQHRIQAINIYRATIEDNSEAIFKFPTGTIFLDFCEHLSGNIGSDFRLIIAYAIDDILLNQPDIPYLIEFIPHNGLIKNLLFENSIKKKYLSTIGLEDINGRVNTYSVFVSIVE